jgi:hypothetical protein
MVRHALTLALALAAAAPLLAQSPLPDTSGATKSTPTPTTAAAPDSAPPSADSLAAISRRGRAIAEADHVVWLASGAIASSDLPVDSIRRFIPRRTDRGWEVAAGTLSDDGSAYMISRLATPGIQPDVWASSLFDPALPDTGYFARAARAVESALTMFQPVEQRPYVATVLPADDGPWWHPARAHDRRPISVSDRRRRWHSRAERPLGRREPVNAVVTRGISRRVATGGRTAAA